MVQLAILASLEDSFCICGVVGDDCVRVLEYLFPDGAEKALTAYAANEMSVNGQGHHGT